MTFFWALIFMFMVFWRPQDWLWPWMRGWPVLDVVVAIALLAMLLETSMDRIRIRKEVPQVWLLLGLWLATLMSHVAHGYFAGLTIEESAELLGISAPTAKRDWAYSRAWMMRSIQNENREGETDAGADPDRSPAN